MDNAPKYTISESGESHLAQPRLMTYTRFVTFL